MTILLARIALIGPFDNHFRALPMVADGGGQAVGLADRQISRRGRLRNYSGSLGESWPAPNVNKDFAASCWALRLPVSIPTRNISRGSRRFSVMVRFTRARTTDYSGAMSLLGT